MNKVILGAFALASTLLISCKKESVDEGKFKPATLNLMLETKIGDDNVAKNKEYISEKDTFSIKELKYYLSNFTFVNSTNGTSKKIEGSYVLYNLENGTTKNTSFEIDEAFTFDKLQVSFGVDSVANGDFFNTSGDLNPAGTDGMAWNWKIGYKFIKFEGDTKNAPFVQHIGTNTNYSVIELPVSGTLEEDGSYSLHIQADILALLNGHHKFDLNSTSSHGGHGAQHPIAKNTKMNFLSIHHFTGGQFTIGNNKEEGHQHTDHDHTHNNEEHAH